MGDRIRTLVTPAAPVAVRRPKPFSLGLALASILVASAARADLGSCLDETGYALVGRRSALILHPGEPVWFFDPVVDEVFCAPPH